MRSILTALQEGRLFELLENLKRRVVDFSAQIIEANPVIQVDTDPLEKTQVRKTQCKKARESGSANGEPAYFVFENRGYAQSHTVFEGVAQG